MIVELTWGEVRIAAHGGLERRLFSLAQGYRDRNGAPSSVGGWQLDIQGALGEFVYAKATGLWWAGANPRPCSEGDVARIQVRSTPRDDGSLIVHPEDPDAAAFVLVAGQAPRFRIPGWLPAAQAKDPRWWRSDIRTPAFLVPQVALRPFTDLADEQ